MYNIIYMTSFAKLYNASLIAFRFSTTGWFFAFRLWKLGYRNIYEMTSFSEAVRRFFLLLIAQIFI